MIKNIMPLNWQRMTNTQKKEAVESAAETVMENIEALLREPNDWERLHLSSALNGAYTGHYDVAWTHVWLAGRPVPENVPPLPELRHLGIWQLRTMLAAVERSPTRIYFELDKESATVA